MKFDIPVYVQKVLGVLTNSGFEAYVVGGAVRDLLLEKIPEDYDVVTNARPDEIKLLAERNGIGVVAGLGQNFGVVMLTLGRNSVEGTSFANCQTEKTATLFCGSGERDFLREKNSTNTSRSPFPSKKGEPLWEKQ